MKRKKTSTNVIVLDSCREFRNKATTRGRADEEDVRPIGKMKCSSETLIAMPCGPNEKTKDGGGGDGHGRDVTRVARGP